MNSDEINIVVARLESMPASLKLNIGGHKLLGKWDLIKHVQEDDEIGELVVSAYMDNIRSYKQAIQ